MENELLTAAERGDRDQIISLLHMQYMDIREEESELILHEAAVTAAKHAHKECVRILMHWWRGRPIYATIDLDIARFTLAVGGAPELLLQLEIPLYYWEAYIRAVYASGSIAHIDAVDPTRKYSGCVAGRVELIDRLLESRAYVHLDTRDRLLFACVAASRGADTRQLRDILRVTQHDPRALTEAAEYAAYTGKVWALRWLLAAGAPLPKYGVEKAAANGHAECVRVLLSAGAPLLLCYPGPGGYDWPRGDTPGVARSREEIASAISMDPNRRLQVEAEIKKYNTPPKWAWWNQAR